MLSLTLNLTTLRTTMVATFPTATSITITPVDETEAMVTLRADPRTTALAEHRTLMAPDLMLRPDGVLVVLDVRPTLVTLVLCSTLRGLRDRNEPPDADATVLALVAPKVTRLQLPLVPRTITAALLDALLGEEVAREHVL